MYVRTVLVSITGVYLLRQICQFLFFRLFCVAYLCGNDRSKKTNSYLISAIEDLIIWGKGDLSEMQRHGKNNQKVRNQLNMALILFNISSRAIVLSYMWLKYASNYTYNYFCVRVYQKHYIRLNVCHM